MSMLLDALRKSEKRQRAKALPDIHAEAAPDMDRRTGWPRPLWLALTIAGILVLVSAAWYFWPQADEGMPEGTAVPGAGAGANAQGGAKTQQDGAPKKSGRKPASPVETLADTEPPGDGAGQAKLTKAERQAQRKADRQAKRKAERQATRQAQREAARQAERQAAAPDQDNSSPQPRRSAVPQLPAEKQSADAARGQGGDDAGAPAAGGATAESQPISYWELPAAVRNQLPEMNISVLVFAERPADRFVLMDGQRLAEGDQLQDGLTLQEVRRDGAVMRFKMYRFLVSYG